MRRTLADKQLNMQLERNIVSTMKSKSPRFANTSNFWPAQSYTTLPSPHEILVTPSANNRSSNAYLLNAA